MPAYCPVSTAAAPLAEPEFLIFAKTLEFQSAIFNPGGNHGSFLRISTIPPLFAGGADTGIPRHLRIQEPYDSLSFVPTILDLDGTAHGKTAQAARPSDPTEPRA